MSARQDAMDWRKDGGIAQGGVVEARGVDEERSGVGDGVELGDGSTFVEGEKEGFNGWFFFYLGGGEEGERG